MDSIDDNKTKRILCFNAIKGRVCNYGSKCMYAHSLAEQKIDPIRHKVYTILKNDNNLKNINLVKDRKLFTTFAQLTKICYHCSKNECHGGYNCRNGAINQKYKICHDDLMYGNCRRPRCHGLHLTTRGLVPYYIQMNNKKYNKNFTDEENSDEYDSSDKHDKHDKHDNNHNNKKRGSKKKSKSKQPSEIEEDEIEIINVTGIEDVGKIKVKSNPVFIKSKRSLNRNLRGVLVTDNFLVDYYNNKKKREVTDGCDSEESYETISKMREFLSEENSEDSLEESIFKV